MLPAKTALCQNEVPPRATVGVAMDSLEELLETEGLQPDDSFIGWAKAFADAVLEENEVPPDLLELLASTPGADRSSTSSNTQPGVPHPVVAASMTGTPRDESSGLHVIRSENTGVREGSGLRVLPPPDSSASFEGGSGLRAMPGREGSGLRPLPPLPNAGREGSGLHALPSREGSGLHALPNASGEDDDDGEELEMLDDDELELLDEEGDDGDAGASVTGDREAEPEWKRALDDAQSGVLPLPQAPADEATDEAAGEAVDEDEPA